MLDELLARFDGAFAERTLRAYRSDFNRFVGWCSEQGCDPFGLGDAEFVRYIEQMSETLTSATIRRHVASISTVLRLSEHADVTKSPSVELALKRMHRRKGRAQQQAVPLTRDVLEHLLRVCDTSAHGLRDQLLLRLGYETMRRRSELCAFRFEDIEVLPDGRAALRLGFSKTDQYGLGKLIPISRDLAATIKEWGVLLGRRGYLLRRIYRGGVIGDGLHPATVNRRLQTLQQKAGLDLGGRLTGHSFRVGVALDLLESGESLEKIMLRGGWQAESTVICYLRAWQAVS